MRRLADTGPWRTSPNPTKGEAVPESGRPHQDADQGAGPGELQMFLGVQKN